MGKLSCAYPEPASAALVAEIINMTLPGQVPFPLLSTLPVSGGCRADRGESSRNHTTAQRGGDMLSIKFCTRLGGSGFA